MSVSKDIFAWVAVSFLLLGNSAQAQTISQLRKNAYAPGPMTGQSFTATVTGEITAISVADEDGASVTLQIYDGDTGSGIAGGVGNPVYSQPVILNASAMNAVQRIDLATPFPVVAGSKYSFVFSGSLRLHAWSSDDYPGGTLIVDYGTPNVGYDLAFQIYERAAPIPPSTTSVPSSSLWSLMGGSLMIAVITAARRRRWSWR
ncbi:MAG: hypothetical protein EOP24_32975 [Hyphomicrobiales bacterium]|nr:MAG: hypothetical protein EOP24_32975 [Hyphomicrobiales bacterium]